jgi:hypothetical protein
VATIPYSPIEGELWKPISGYDNRYEVSDLGRVRRVKGRGSSKSHPRLLRPAPDTAGYIRINIFYEGKVYGNSVHQLVALAFIGPCPEGYEVNHIDLDKANNRVENLEYLSHLDNVRHAYASGSWNTARGERSGNAKLTDAAVRSIRSDARPQRVVAAEYGISQVSVCLIRQRKSWKHVAD